MFSFTFPSFKRKNILKSLLEFFKNSTGHKPVIVPFTPTAENVAAYIFYILEDKFLDVYRTGLHLQSIKLWETPSSYALYESKVVRKS